MFRKEILNSIDRASSFKIIFYSITVYIFVMFLMIGYVKSNGFYKYFYINDGLYDVEIYVNIAKNGYNTIGNFAIFPLWPFLIQIVSNMFFTNNYMLVANLMALFLFFISLPILWTFFKNVFEKRMALLLFLCFVFNPLSIFHAIGYSESLTTLEFSIWLLLLYRITNAKLKKSFLKNKMEYLFLILISYCIGLSRPLFVQLFLSIVLTFFILKYFKVKIKNFLVPLGISLFSIFAGFFTFALFSYIKGFGFGASFRAQNEWNRVLGLHWDILFHPHSVGGSDNVLNWDLQAFWMPIIIFLALIFKFFIRNNNLKTDKNPIQYDVIFWIALLFSCAHSAVQFLTYDLFFSTSRFIFALPLFFYVIGKTLYAFNFKYKYYILIFYFIYSFSFFIYWWTRFSREGWMG
ncbi:hypothetical protein [Silvanigrella sp.]|jgi:hypothetical protein|uniref:hypothetical protein n=1 Tax=Silvanigrella sp. TaxID=2024976 RepID=UPI0037C8A1E1